MAVTALVGADVSLGALGLPVEGTTVVQMRINRMVQKVKSQYRLDKSLILHKGDEMTVSALPHRLALLTAESGAKGKLLLASKPRVDAVAGLEQSHAMLTHLAQRLAQWLQSLVRVHLARRARARRAHAALVIQSQSRRRSIHPSPIATPPPAAADDRLLTTTTTTTGARISGGTSSYPASRSVRASPPGALPRLAVWGVMRQSSIALLRIAMSFSSCSRSCRVRLALTPSLPPSLAPSLARSLPLACVPLASQPLARVPLASQPLVVVPLLARARRWSPPPPSARGPAASRPRETREGESSGRGREAWGAGARGSGRGPRARG